MSAPLVCFVAYKRLGSTVCSLDALLKTEDDFELVIVDNASNDGTWEYIENIKDERIKIKHQVDKNYGIIYALNYGLSKREKYQPFIHVENDIQINDKDWVTRFKKTAALFPEIGLIGISSKQYEAAIQKQFPPDERFLKRCLADKVSHKMNMRFIPETREDITCYYNPVVIGCCNYITPEVIELIGYRNEESCGADLEIGRRINLFTPYFSAVATAFYIDYIGVVDCPNCIAKGMCKYSRNTRCSCHDEYMKFYTHRVFAETLRPKVAELISDIKENKRPLYSASIHDEESIQNNYYDKEAAMKNFEFFANFNKSDSSS